MSSFLVQVVAADDLPHESRYTATVLLNGRVRGAVRQTAKAKTRAPRFDAHALGVPAPDPLYDTLVVRLTRKANAVAPVHAAGECVVPLLLAAARLRHPLALSLSLRKSAREQLGLAPARRGAVTLLVAFARDRLPPPPPRATRVRPGRLSLHVIEGRDVRFSCPSLGAVGPFNVVLGVGVDRKTSELDSFPHRKCGTHPVFNAALLCDSGDPERDTLEINVRVNRDKPKCARGVTTPTRFVGRVRVPVLVLAAHAAETGQPAELDHWFPLLDRFAKTQSDMQVARLARLHLLLRYDPAPVDAKEGDDNGDPLADSHVGHTTKIVRLPFVGGRVLMSETCTVKSFNGRKQKPRKVLLVDGTGTLPPCVVLEDARVPVREPFSVLPHSAIMGDSEASRYESSTLGGCNITDNDGDVEEEEDVYAKPRRVPTGGSLALSSERKLSSSLSTQSEAKSSPAGTPRRDSSSASLAASDGDASVGSSANIPFGRYIVLPGALLKLTANVLTVQAVGASDCVQELTFESVKVAERWLAALETFKPVYRRWYASSTSDADSNVVRLGDSTVSRSTLNSDEPIRGEAPVYSEEAVRDALATALDTSDPDVDQVTAVARLARIPVWLSASIVEHFEGIATDENDASSGGGSDDPAAARSRSSTGDSAPGAKLTSFMMRMHRKHCEIVRKQSERTTSLYNKLVKRRGGDNSSQSVPDANGKVGDGQSSSASNNAEQSSNDDAAARAKPPLHKNDSASTDAPFVQIPVELSYSLPPPPLNSEYSAPPSAIGRTASAPAKGPPKRAEDDPYFVPDARSNETVNVLIGASGDAVRSAAPSETETSAFGDYDKVPPLSDANATSVMDRSMLPSAPPKSVIYADPQASQTESAADDDDDEGNGGSSHDAISELAREYESKVSRRYRIQYDELGAMSRELGRGQGGVVYKSRFREADVAVKVIARGAEREALREFFEEALLLLDMPPHPNVVAPLGMSFHPLCVVMTFCANGSLSSALNSVALVGKLTLPRKIAILGDVSAGMHHVAREGIVHKDLAARNVLLSGSLAALVSDFGLSRLVNPNGAVYDSGIAAVKWSSPEAILQRRYTEASDVWSFGVTCVETLTAEAPLASLSTSDYLLAYSAKKDAYRTQLIADVPESAGEELRAIVASCLQNEPDARPTFQQLCHSLRALIETTESGDVVLLGGDNADAGDANGAVLLGVDALEIEVAAAADDDDESS